MTVAKSKDISEKAPLGGAFCLGPEMPRAVSSGTKGVWRDSPAGAYALRHLFEITPKGWQGQLRECVELSTTGYARDDRYDQRKITSK